MNIYNNKIIYVRIYISKNKYHPFHIRNMISYFLSKNVFFFKIVLP